MADEAKADLEEAMPALNAAIDSLKALNKNDIVEIKSFPKPPPLVQMTMEAVCILKQEKPDWDTVSLMSAIQPTERSTGVACRSIALASVKLPTVHDVLCLRQTLAARGFSIM